MIIIMADFTYVSTCSLQPQYCSALWLLHEENTKGSSSPLVSTVLHSLSQSVVSSSNSVNICAPGTAAGDSGVTAFVEDDDEELVSAVSQYEAQQNTGM